MLRISPRSWHYRVWALGRETYYGEIRSRPKNLCLYFWHIVLKLAIAAVIVGLALSGLGALAYVFITEPVTSIIVTLSIVLGIALLIGAVYGTVRLARWKKKRDDEFWNAVNRGEIPPPQPRQPGPFRLWLKARKEKMCPLIEVVDDRSNS